MILIDANLLLYAKVADYLLFFPLNVLPQWPYIEAEHEKMLIKSEYFVYACLLHKHEAGAVGEGKILVVVLAEEGFGSLPDSVIDMPVYATYLPVLPL